MYGMNTEEIRYYMQESRRLLAQDMRDSCRIQNTVLLKCGEILIWAGAQLVICGQRVKPLNDFSESVSDGMILTRIAPVIDG